MKDILSSKYIRILIITVILIIISFFAIGGGYIKWQKIQANKPPVDVSAFAEIVVPFGEFEDVEKYYPAEPSYKEPDINYDNPKEGSAVPYMKYGDKWIMRAMTEKSGLYPATEYFYVADGNYNPVFNGMIFNKLNVCNEGKYLYGEIYNNVTIDSSKEEINKTEDVKQIVLNSDGKVLYESAQQLEDTSRQGEYNIVRVFGGFIELEKAATRRTYKYIELSKVEAGDNNTRKTISGGEGQLNSQFSSGIAIGIKDRKCSVIDAEFNDLTGFIFDSAFVLEDRQCLVESNGKWAVIKLQ